MDAANSLAEMVRRHDPDRFFCALFAPAAARDALFTLYAYNHELARAREVASDPTLALIRLQWWREVIEGAPRRHEVATPLAALIAGGLEGAPLLAMIETREAQVEGPPDTLDAFMAQMRAGPGALAAASGAVLGADAAARARLVDLGAAYGIAGTLRSVGALAAQDRCLLPLDVLAAAGLSPEAAIASPDAALAAVGPGLTRAARDLLAAPQWLHRAVRAAALPAVLAQRDLARAPLATPRGLGDRLSVLRAALLQPRY